MSTVLLLLDAFRHDYMTEKTTPFIWKCAQEGEHYKGVEPSLGFCERSEILSGLSGDKTGFFTAIGFDPENSPYRKSTSLRLLQMSEDTALLLLRCLPHSLSARIHKKLRTLVASRFKKLGIMMSTYLIPYPWLPFFALTEDRIDHRKPEAFPVPSILELLNNAGKTYYYDTFTALNFRSPYDSDQERLDAVVRDSGGSPKDLYLVYIAAPDAYGHHFGPESPEFREELRRLDGDLERFVHRLEEQCPGNRYLFIGDHGMVTVSVRVDAEKEILRLLRSAGLRKGRDVIYFLDSTMVRLWAISKKAEDLLPKLLANSEVFSGNGAWMDESTAKINHVPWPDRRYGDHLWVAYSGVLVFPDFFHRLEPCKGMHGYDPRLEESRGSAIFWGKGIESSKKPIMSLTGAFDILKRSLEL